MQTETGLIRDPAHGTYAPVFPKEQLHAAPQVSAMQCHAAEGNHVSADVTGAKVPSILRFKAQATLEVVATFELCSARMRGSDRRTDELP